MNTMITDAAVEAARLTYHSHYRTTSDVSDVESFRAALEAALPLLTPEAGNPVSVGQGEGVAFDAKVAEFLTGCPVAWFTEDHLTDKSATTYDPVVADRWRAKGWPVSPLYAQPAPKSEPAVTMDDAIAAGDGTLNGAIDYWQCRALAAEAKLSEPAADDERERFEAWARGQDHGLVRTEHGVYCFTRTRVLWEAWQAATASRQKEVK